MPIVIVSSSITIVFESDDSFSFRGFSLRYRVHIPEGIAIGKCLRSDVNALLRRQITVHEVRVEYIDIAIECFNI